LGRTDGKCNEERYDNEVVGLKIAQASNEMQVSYKEGRGEHWGWRLWITPSLMLL
jgi:hypothetical protein